MASMIGMSRTSRPAGFSGFNLGRVRFAVLALTLLGFGSSAKADADRARQTFHLCAACHGTDGGGNQELKAPPIAGLPDWYIKNQLDKFRAGIRGAHPKDIVGLRMRPMGRHLNDEDAALMVSHVAAMPAVPQKETVKGNLVKGEGTYQTCLACHGAKGEGNQQLGAPPLVRLADWYMIDQLAKFKAGIRGGNPAADPIGATMQGIAGILDEESMKNVVAYVNTLKPAR